MASNYSGRRIRIDSAFLLDVAGDAESTTRTVNDQSPRFVGVPAIRPVALSRVSPGGSVPEVTDHLNGALPPDSVSATE